MAEPKKFADLNIKIKPNKLSGQKQNLKYVLDQSITVHAFRIQPSKYPDKSEKCLWLQYSHNDKMYVAFSIATLLIQTLEQTKDDDLPFTTTITNKNEIYEFT